MKIVLKTDVAKKLFQVIASGISSERNATYQSMYCKNIGDGNMFVRAMDKTHIMQMTVTMFDSNDFDQIYIPFFDVNKFLPKFRSETTTFEVIDDNVLKVSSGRTYSKFSLVNAQSPINIQAMTSEQLSIVFDVPKKVIVNVKNKLSGLVSTENNRPVLNGVCLDIVNGEVRFVASDGRKLSVYYTGVNVDESVNLSVVIPIATINTVCSAVKSQAVKIGFANNVVKFVSTDLTYYSTVISGDYPPYAKIVASTDKNDNVITVNKSQLVDALSFVNVNFDATKKCQLKFQNNMVSLDCDNGANHEQFEVEYNGQFDCLINSQFLEKMIKPVQDNNIVFKVASPTQALLMEADQLKMILMPLRQNR